MISNRLISFNHWSFIRNCRSNCKYLASKKAKIVLGSRREDKLKALTEEIQKAGGQTTHRVTDVVNQDDSQQFV